MIVNIIYVANHEGGVIRYGKNIIILFVYLGIYNSQITTYLGIYNPQITTYSKQKQQQFLSQVFTHSKVLVFHNFIVLSIDTDAMVL